MRKALRVIVPIVLNLFWLLIARPTVPAFSMSVATDTTRICGQFLHLSDPKVETPGILSLLIAKDGIDTTTILMPTELYRGKPVIKDMWYHFMLENNKVVDREVIQHHKTCPRPQQAAGDVASNIEVRCGQISDAIGWDLKKGEFSTWIRFRGSDHEDSIVGPRIEKLPPMYTGNSYIIHYMNGEPIRIKNLIPVDSCPLPIKSSPH